MTTQAEAPPNILLILTDQHHALAMGCAGNPQVKTPNLDRLAASGVRFPNAYSVSAHCGPSRLSLFTGLYEHTHRRHGNEEEPPAWLDTLTLPAALKASGYQTALIGKGHLGVEWPRRQFDYGKYSFISDAPAGDQRNSDYYRWLDDAGLADLWDDIDPFLYEAGRRAGVNGAFRTAKIPLEHSVETWCGNETIRYLRQRDPERPFFALMSFDRPHNPLTVPTPYDTMYDPEEIVLPENAGDDFSAKDEYQQRAVRGGRLYPYRPSTKRELKECMAAYYGLVSLIDHQVGRVLEELETQGTLDNTIIVFTADHGDFAGEHGLMFKKLGIYDSVHRIPLLMNCPSRVPSGTMFDGIIEQVDLFPALAELAGADVPASVEGRSFVEPMLRGNASGWNKKGALCEHVTVRYHHVSLRTPRYRLSYDLTGDAGTGLYELYDYGEDLAKSHRVFQGIYMEFDWRRKFFRMGHKLELCQKSFVRVLDYSAKKPHDPAMSVSLRLRRREYFPNARAQVAVVRQTRQAAIGPHRHEFVELVVILGGTGVHRIGGESHVLRAGDIMVINCSRPHAYCDTRDLHLVNVLIREEIIRTMEADFARLPGFHALFTLESMRWRAGAFPSRLRLNSSDLRQVSEWIDALEYETRRTHEGGRLMARSWLVLLIGLLSRRYGHGAAKSADIPLRLGRVLSRMEQFLAEPLRLPELAREAAMSERTFLRRFREATGYSPIAYLLRGRVRHAAELLRQNGTDLSLPEIAARCGFEDSNYFSRQFRKIMGDSPRGFLRRGK